VPNASERAARFAGSYLPALLESLKPVFDDREEGVTTVLCRRACPLHTRFLEAPSAEKAANSVAEAMECRD